MFSITLVPKSRALIVRTHEKRSEVGLVRIHAPDSQMTTRDSVKRKVCSSYIAKTSGRIDSTHHPCSMGMPT